MNSPVITGMFAPSRLARRPYCSNDPSLEGVRIRGAQQALARSHIQPNTPALRWRIVFDIDRPGALFAAEDANVAPPNWIAVNPRNGHAHAGYELETPVVMSESGRAAPVRYAVSVEHAYRRALGADMAYSGLICKNPLHDRWWTHVQRARPYDLNELAEYVDLPKNLTPKQAEETVIGRNVRLFDRLRHWAYRNIRNYERRAEWALACQAKAGELNAYDTPLGASEVLHIARSVEKWSWSKFDPAASDAKFSKLQAYRGKKGGTASGKVRLAASEDKRVSAHVMRASGMTLVAIAAELGVSTRTAIRWLEG